MWSSPLKPPLHQARRDLAMIYGFRRKAIELKIAELAGDETIESETKE